MPAYQRLRQQLQHQAQITAGHLIETGTTVVVTYGGGPANQYGLQSSGTAIVDDLTARGVTATQIPANSDHGFGRLVDLDPARVVVWVTDPYRFRAVPDGRIVRSDLRHDLQAFGLPVVSQSARCSAATLYKDETSAVAQTAGLRTIPGVRVAQGNGDVDEALALLAAQRRVITKPVDGDEGQGVSLVESEAQLLAAIAAIHDTGTDALAETCTSGTQVGIPVLVLENEIVALPAVEASAAAVIIDHQVKTTRGALRLFCPPRYLVPSVLDRLATQAVALASQLDARALLRADFIVDQYEVPWFLEANSFPGLSPTGLVMASLTRLDLTRGDLALLVISRNDEG